MNNSKPNLVITMGDPAGIGPEICLKALNSDYVKKHCCPILFGDFDVLTKVASLNNLSLDHQTIALSDFDKNQSFVKKPTIVDFSNVLVNSLKPGRVNANSGKSSFDYLQYAIKYANAGLVDGIVTAPINKYALKLAGVNYPGHTEILKKYSNSKDVCMMLSSDKISCSLVTAHVGLSEVPGLLGINNIYRVIKLTHSAIKSLKGKSSSSITIGVLALNPHGGENGLFGQNEENKFIKPAIEKAKSDGIRALGPLVPDTAFVESNLQSIDAFVCMYHDQGLIPLKTLAFNSAINITLGLPIIRTSVDHGTALDIAWKGLADTKSLYHAIKVASKLSKS